MSKLYLKKVGLTTLKKWCIYYNVNEASFKEKMKDYRLHKFAWLFGKHIDKKFTLGSKTIIWTKIIIRTHDKYIFPKTILLFKKDKKIWLDEYDWKKYANFIKWSRNL